MANQELALKLHDRATRGESLTALEQATLDAWYAERDHAELAALAARPPAASVEELRVQVNDALAALQAAVQRLQRQVAVNDALRAEIEALQKRLLQSRTAQPA
jgi:hypothetical protein